MSIAAPDENSTKTYTRPEFKEVLDLLTWANDFGLIDLYLDDDGEPYYTPVYAECDDQHCTAACKKPRQRVLTRLLGWFRRP